MASDLAFFSLPSTRLPAAPMPPAMSGNSNNVHSNSNVIKQGVQVDVELHLPVKKLWDALKNITYVAPTLPALKLNHRVIMGNGGVGSVSVVQFPDGRYETERVDKIDDRNHTMISSVVAQGYHAYTKTVFLSSSRGGSHCVARWRAEYAPMGERSLASAASQSALSLFMALENQHLSEGQELSSFTQHELGY